MSSLLPYTSGLRLLIYYSLFFRVPNPLHAHTLQVEALHFLIEQPLVQLESSLIKAGCDMRLSPHTHNHFVRENVKHIPHCPSHSYLPQSLTNNSKTRVSVQSISKYETLFFAIQGLTGGTLFDWALVRIN